jgi:putative aldouronate transport system permease protein
MSYVLTKSKSDRVVDFILYASMTVFCLATLFPLYYVLVISVTPLVELTRNGGFVMFPSKLTFEAYHSIFSSQRIPQALKITIILATLGTFLNLLVTTLLAYPLSKKFLPGRKVVLLGIVFTLLFSGGLIPLYLTVKATGLMNSIWALIIPGLVSSFNMLVMKTYFENLPQEVEEAARVDGCSELQTLLRIVLPLSMPIMATLGLFYGVAHWNSFFGGIMYITDLKLQPIQVVLRSMIQTPNVSSELQLSSAVLDQLPPQTIKMAIVVVTIAPILAIYPFLQRYFIKGLLIGAIKG